MQGTLQLFRTQQQLDGTAKDVEVLEASGVPYQLLDREGCVQHQPALAGVKQKFGVDLRLPGEETGDCFKSLTRRRRLRRLQASPSGSA